MSVYVDNFLSAYRSMKMCHMMADTREELDAMADRIGLSRRWIQHAGTPREHYDICMSKRRLAVSCGAVEVAPRDIVALMRRKEGRG